MTQGGKTSNFDVATTNGDTFLLTGEDGTQVSYVNSLVGNLKFTTAMGLSTFGNATYPDSFSQAMRSNDTMSLTMFACNRWGKNQTCDFDMSVAMALAN